MNLRLFLAELRSRGVYRAAAIYAAGAWALLQVADVTFPLLGIGEGAIELILVMAALGFPIAMVLAWVFDLTAHGIVETPAQTTTEPITFSAKKTVEIAIILVLILLVGFLYVDRLMPNGAAPRETARSSGLQSIAVIPFVNMSQAKDMAYFGDGLAEEILNLLTRINEINVTARTSSFYFKDKDVDIPTIGSHLGVEHILAGSVRYEGDRIRVTVELVNTKDGFHLWSETYDRERTNVFSLQDEIAAKVVDSLHVILSNESRKLLARDEVVNSLAFDYYLRGRDYLRRVPDQTALDNAKLMFDKAVEVEPAYADAYAGLCDTHLMRYRMTHANEDFLLAESACQQALSLNSHAVPVYVALGNLYRHSGKYGQSKDAFAEVLSLAGNSVEAHVGLGETLELEGQFDAAADEFLTAIELQPNYWPAHMSMGNLLFSTGKPDEAIPYYQSINDLIPESGIATNNLGGAYYLTGRFEEAIRTWQDSLRRSPTAVVFSNLGSSFFFLRQFDQAIEMYRQAIALSPENFELWGNLADAHRLAGADDETVREHYETALKLAHQRLEINPSDATTLSLTGLYHANLGSRGPGIDALEKATRLAPDDMFVFYFAATALARIGELDKAMDALERAVELGYFKQLVRADAGLDGLRNLARYQALMEEAQ